MVPGVMGYGCTVRTCVGTRGMGPGPGVYWFLPCFGCFGEFRLFWSNQVRCWSRCWSRCCPSVGPVLVPVSAQCRPSVGPVWAQSDSRTRKRIIFMILTILTILTFSMRFARGYFRQKPLFLLVYFGQKTTLKRHRSLTEMSKSGVFPGPKVVFFVKSRPGSFVIVHEVWLGVLCNDHFLVIY